MNKQPLSSGLSERDMVRSRLAKTLRRRHARERRFRMAGVISAGLALVCVLLLFGSILQRGLPAFWQSSIQLSVYFDPDIIKADIAPQRLPNESSAEFQRRQLDWQGQLARSNWQRLLVQGVQQLYPEQHIQPRHAQALFTRAVQHQLREIFVADPGLLGQTLELSLLADANVDVWLRAKSTVTCPMPNNNCLHRYGLWPTSCKRMVISNSNLPAPCLAMPTRAVHRPPPACSGPLSARCTCWRLYCR